MGKGYENIDDYVKGKVQCRYCLRVTPAITTEVCAYCHYIVEHLEKFCTTEEGRNWVRDVLTDTEMKRVR
jgi:hypothetical protein